MNRAFTISFDFGGKTYLALASIKNEKAADTAYSIHLYGTSLTRIFPDGTLNYSSEDVNDFHGSLHPLSKPLFRCIHQSVQAHLELAQQYH